MWLWAQAWDFTWTPAECYLVGIPLDGHSVLWVKNEKAVIRSQILLLAVGDLEEGQTKPAPPSHQTPSVLLLS